MKLLISNQHGAIVMALMPFLYGMLLATPVWQHIFLLLAWFSLYLMSYPFLNLFKGRNLELYLRWTLIYAAAALVLSVPALLYNRRVLCFVAVIAALSLVSVYYSKKKDERALLNDLNAILIFAVAGMAAYYFSENRFDQKIWQTAIYPSLFFIGTTLYVKSVLRERKNPRYMWASISFHLCCVGLFLPLQQYDLALVFILPLLRALWRPQQKRSAKQAGLTEMALSLLFFAALLVATL